MTEFVPGEVLLDGVADARCRATVVLPVRDEERSLGATLDALARQVDVTGAPLPTGSYEVLLLLNNCTDGSAAVARAWKRAHPETVLHCCEREFPKETANIGTVRKMLMDTAWQRLCGRPERCAILSSDADSYAAPDWIARNLDAIGAGADAVGGELQLICNEIGSLPEPVREAYAADRRYQYLVAEMEDLIDPQAGDAWPRHLEHFGASLGCTPEIYARAGGMPAVAELEDVAFVDRLRRVDARLRHQPGVVVYTSARLDGRTATGLAGQLRCWQQMQADGREHTVASAEFLHCRFKTLQRLRAYYVTEDVTYLKNYSREWQMRAGLAREGARGAGEFLAVMDCDRLIDEAYRGEREGEIGAVNAAIARRIAVERGRRQAETEGVPELLSLR